MKNKISIPVLLTSLLCLVPMVIGLIIYKDLPDAVPIHWNAAGQIDDYASKAVAVFGLPLFLFVVDLVVILLMHFDPKRAGQSAQMKRIVFLMMPLISMIMVPATYLIAMGRSIAMDTVVLVIVGILFILLGNAMPKNRQNYTMGIRLSWTLDDPDNWFRTHRLASYVWVIIGFSSILLAFADMASISKAISALILLIIAVSVPVIYSFRLYYQKSHQS